MAISEGEESDDGDEIRNTEMGVWGVGWGWKRGVWGGSGEWWNRLADESTDSIPKSV